MKWSKVIVKAIYGLVTGLSASIISNPEAVVTLAGQANSVKIGAIVALITGISNFIKHKEF